MTYDIYLDIQVYNSVLSFYCITSQKKQGDTPLDGVSSLSYCTGARVKPNLISDFRNVIIKL